ncbi:MAG TPA: DUF1549 domain-containing protein, partial [Gemmataceae bacterium]
MQATPLLLTTLLAAGAAAPDVDFDTDVIPVLTRAGCNAGACHGAAAGRGGFRLSLFGSDPEFDHRSIVRELEGRRVNLASPDESLLLLKPTSAVRHGGGARLDLEGEGADLLRRWIASGAARAKARRLLDLRVSPEVHVADRPGGSVPLRATARFDDGSSRDVTRWTVFTPEDPSAVAIDGRTATAQLLRRGRHVIVARYLDRVVPVQVIVPLSDRPVDLTREPRRNFIDGHILELLTKLRLPVSPPADDATFLRRVTLDLTGRLPTPEQVFAFAGDGRPDKRDRLIDRLLASEEFNDYWTYRLAGLLRIRSGAHDGTGVRTYHRWLREQVASGAPYDRIARELLTAEGDAHAVGPANFYRTTGDARQQAEFVSELFLGSRLRCANCHNHPLDRWTQDDYHGLAAVFARVER